MSWMDLRKNSSSMESPQDFEAYLASLNSSPAGPAAAVSAPPARAIVPRKPKAGAPRQTIPMPPDPSQMKGNNAASLFPDLGNLQQATGSGITQSHELDSNTKSTSGQTRAHWAEAPEVNGIMDTLRSTPEAAAQREGQAGLYNLLAMEAGSGQKTDLSPLGDFANYATHGEYKSSEKPVDQKILREAMLKYGEKAQDDQRDIFKTILEGAQKFKSGQDSQQLINAIATKNALKGQDPLIAQAKGGNKEVTNLDKWVKLSRAELDKHTERSAHIDEIKAAINSGNPNAIRNIPVALGKLFAGSRPSNLEIQREAGDPAAFNRLDQWAETFKTGKLTKLNQQQYDSFMRDLGAAESTILKVKAARLKQIGYGKGGYGVDKNQVDSWLNENMLNSMAQPSKGGPAKDRSKMTLEELKAEAAARGL